MSRYAYDLPEHPVEYGVEVAVSDLTIDVQAQRTLNEKRAQSIADGLVREAMGALVVSQRASGKMFIVDGQHRWRVCQLVGIEKIACEVHRGLTQQQEAVLFLIKNKESAKPSALDEYKVGLTGGVPLFVDTEKVLTQHNLSMGTTSVNTIGAVAGVVRITDSYGPEVLDRVLTVAELAWGRTASTWDGMLLGGLGMFLGKHGELASNNDDLAARLQKFGLAQLWIARVITVASQGGTQQTGTGSRVSTMYGLVVSEWNKGRRKNKIIL